MEPTKCVLCLDSILSHKSGTNDDTETADAKINDKTNASDNDRSKSVFLEFCKCFSINLPSEILSWDFHKELVPICNECQSTADRLVNLHEELRNLQKELQETEKCVRNRISESQTLLNRSPVDDRRILVVRDLIVGPVVSLENNEVPPIYFCSAAVETISASDDDDEHSDYATPFDIKEEAQSDLETNEANEQTEVFNESAENSVIIDQDELISDEEEKPEIKVEVQAEPEVQVEPEMQVEAATQVGPETMVQTETLIFETDGEFGGTEIRRNPPRRRRPRKYIEPAEDSESETDMTRGTGTSQPPQIGHTVGIEDTEGDQLGVYHVEEDQDTDDDADDFEDDPRDKDFILPDDAAQTLKADSRLESQFRHTLHSHRNKHRPKEERATASQRYGGKAPFKVIKVDRKKWDYGGHKFTKVDEDFTCISCEKTFSRLYIVTRHIRERHLGFYNRQCELCGKTFTSSACFSGHMKSVHGPARPSKPEQPVICEFCGKEFKKVGLLREHLKRMHISEGELKLCDICGKGFKTTNQVNLHKRCVHAKEKRVYCEVCGMGFYNIGRLKRHMFAHSEEKSFECELCGQKLAHYGGLYRHKKQFHESQSSVSGPSDSSEAPAAVNGPAEPAKVIENPEDVMCTATLKCKLCGLQYNRQNNLTRHILQIHHINVKGYAWKCKGFKRPHVRVKE